MRVAIYNDTQILMVMESNDVDLIQLNAGDNQYIEVDSTFNASRYEVVNGEFILRTTKTLYEIQMERNRDVANIKATTQSGKVFDGDEKSQDRMLRAIQISAITGVTQTQWKLADNTITTVTLDELKEALSLAGNAMSQIWLQ